MKILHRDITYFDHRGKPSPGWWSTYEYRCYRLDVEIDGKRYGATQKMHRLQDIPHDYIWDRMIHDIGYAIAQELKDQA